MAPTHTKASVAVVSGLGASVVQEGKGLSGLVHHLWIDLGVQNADGVITDGQGPPERIINGAIA